MTLRRLVSYRTLVYIAIFFSGAMALVFQVAWQRYLSFLVGSEARSISLVVAVFLLGLAAGYRFWGNLTERNWSRNAIMKAVGFIELGIAAYALVFPTYFGFVQEFANIGPDWLLFDLLLAGALLLLPTFLMGASIPLLTAAVPAAATEVNYCHSRIYGINTLGAFLGALVAGFYLVPHHGLPMSLVIGALVNIGVGFVFLLNPLQGPAHKAEDIPRIPNRFGSAGIYLFVFTTGAVSIALEVLFMRVVGLTIGSGHYVFPIVVGVVILGLAIGSLSLRRGSVTAARVPRELIKVSILLVIIYMLIPYWPYWLSHVRVSLATIPSNYVVYLAITVLFVAAMLLPLFIPLGRLLPIGYTLIDKNRNDYGKVCGRVYFANTLGTVVGAVVIGYAMFAWLDLPNLFKLNIMLLLVLAGILAFRSDRRATAGVCVVAAMSVWLAPQWDRATHVTGLFRHTHLQEFHFKGLFNPPTFAERMRGVMLRDDPNMTVAAYRVSAEIDGSTHVTDSMTITVNGKSDGNTIADYSNMVLTGILPYLFAPSATDLDVAVVGLGTGMTSGAIASTNDVKQVTTLEISPAVIETMPLFAEYNFDLARNPKARVVETDAFRYFARQQHDFDVIISEPSNPWVVGVENLFTPEFYQLVTRSLAEDGIFFQWLQLYEINGAVLAAAIENVVREFPYTAIFAIGSGDVGIIASHKPLSREHLMRRFAEPAVQRALAPLGIDDPAILSVLNVGETPHLYALAILNLRPQHSVEFPWIGHEAGRARFLRSGASVRSPALLDIGRHLPFKLTPRIEEFAHCMTAYRDQLDRWCKPTVERFAAYYICSLMTPLEQDYRNLQLEIAGDTCQPKLTAYNRLREQGYAAVDLDMLNQVQEFLRDNIDQVPEETRKPVITQLVMEYALEWQWETAKKTAEEFYRLGQLSLDELMALQKELEALAERTRGWSEQLAFMRESIGDFKLPQLQSAN